MSVNSSNFTSVFFKAAYHANLGAKRNFVGSSSFILICIFQKFSKTSPKSNVSLLRYKS